MKVALSFSLFLCLIAGLPAYAAKPTPYKVGDTPFEYLGKTPDGQEIHLADYKGRVVIVSFWASWCGPCKKELPVLVGLQKKVSTDQLQVISINLDENRRLFKQLAEALATTPLVLISDIRHRTKRKYGVEGIPHMLILNREGKVAQVNIGYGDNMIPELIKQVNQVLAK